MFLGHGGEAKLRWSGLALLCKVSAKPVHAIYSAICDELLSLDCRRLAVFGTTYSTKFLLLADLARYRNFLGSSAICAVRLFS